MKIYCEYCSEELGDIKGNTYNGEAEIELTGKIFAGRQIIAIICPKCKYKTEILEVI